MLSLEPSLPDPVWKPLPARLHQHRVLVGAAEVGRAGQKASVGVGAGGRQRGLELSGAAGHVVGKYRVVGGCGPHVPYGSCLCAFFLECWLHSMR